MTQHEVIIVGAGTAGMSCAIELAKRGIHVLVLEKDSKIGGTLHLTGGHMSAGGTKRQKEKNISDTVSAHLEDIKNISGESINPGLTKLACEEAPKWADWLQSEGFEFAEESPRIIYGHVPYTEARTFYGKEAGKSILKILKKHWDKYCEQNIIRVYTDNPMTDLIVEDDKILGVKTPQESFYGKNIVLATGGYGGDPDFFATKHPQQARLKSSANPLATGDAIKICEQLDFSTGGFQHHVGSLGGIEVKPGSGRLDF